jgi:epoxide hydrolase-like predicted phosphatase
MAIRAIIFDIGGVLIQEMDLDLGGEWDAWLGLEPGALTQRFIDSGAPQLALVGEISRQEAWRRIGASMGFTDEQLHEYESKLWSQCFLYSDMAHFLKGLRPHYKTATLSNDWQGAREENNRRFGLADAIQVDLMVYSAEEGVAKPDPRIYQLTCDRLGIAPHEALFLDNSLTCVRAAQQLGMHGIHFKNSDQALADLQAFLTQNKDVL